MEAGANPACRLHARVRRRPPTIRCGLLPVAPGRTHDLLYDCVNLFSCSRLRPGLGLRVAIRIVPKSRAVAKLDLDAMSVQDQALCRRKLRRVRQGPDPEGLETSQHSRPLGLAPEPSLTELEYTAFHDLPASVETGCIVRDKVSQVSVLGLGRTATVPRTLHDSVITDGGPRDEQFPVDARPLLHKPQCVPLQYETGRMGDPELWDTGCERILEITVPVDDRGRGIGSRSEPHQAAPRGTCLCSSRSGRDRRNEGCRSTQEFALHKISLS